MGEEPRTDNHGHFSALGQYPYQLDTDSEGGAMGRSAKSLSESAGRRQRALALHLQGSTYQQIGDALGFTPAAAHAAVKKALAERQGPSQGTAESFGVEAARLDMVIAALTPAVQAGDEKAIGRYMQAIARRTELAVLIESAAPVQEPGPAVRTPLDELRSRRAARGAVST